MIFSFGIGLAFSACDQQTDGCLDFRALQVNVAADNACEDCCVYPNLQLQFLPARLSAGTFSELLDNTDTLVLGAKNATQVEFGYYLHDIFLIGEQGNRLQMQDTFTVFSGGQLSNYLYESSVLRVTPYNQVNYQLGTLLDEMTILAVEAKLGLPDEFNGVDHTLQPTSSPLFQDTDSLLLSTLDGSYFDVGFKYVDLSGTRDSLQLSDAGNQSIRWNLPQPLIYTPSYNLLISLAIPVDNLLAIDNTNVSGDIFVNEILEVAPVVSVELSR